MTSLYQVISLLLYTFHANFHLHLSFETFQMFDAKSI